MTLASCSSGLYSHYPKARKHQSKKNIETRKTAFKKVNLDKTTLSVSEKCVLYTVNSKINRLIGTLELTEIKTDVKKNSPPGDGKPRDLTKTNKKAKRAFVSAIIALGSLATGISVSPIFLLVMIPFVVLAFINSIIALKQIKKTGEYGRTKAEFALYSSIPILVLSIVGLLAYLLSNGTGFQIGSFVFY